MQDMIRQLQETISEAAAHRLDGSCSSRQSNQSDAMSVWTADSKIGLLADFGSPEKEIKESTTKARTLRLRGKPAPTVTPPILPAPDENTDIDEINEDSSQEMTQENQDTAVHNTTTCQAHLIRAARNDRSIHITTDNSAKSTSRLSTYKPNCIKSTHTDSSADPPTWTKATPTQPRHQSRYIIQRLCQYSRSKHIRIVFQNVKGLTYIAHGQDYKYYISWCIVNIDADITGMAATNSAW